MSSSIHLADGISWVGYVDWTVRDFHGYNTDQGSTYNAYLVQDEQTALVDSVKAPYVGELLAHIAALAPLESVRYVVCNHAEPDHAGGLPATLAACPNAELVCNAKCKDALSRHFDTSAWRFKVVNEGETLPLGRRTLQFFNTPMVHWPESMVTFVPEDGILFSMDAFGQHFATSERFDDELPLPAVLDAAKTYYANIVMPFGKPVAAALKKLGALPVKMVAPSHGVIWRSHFDAILSAYQGWMECRPAKKVVVFFCSMWGSTRRMASAIAEGAASVPGVSVKFIDVTATPDSATVTELLDCAAFAAGSATLNQGMMPAIARTLTYAKGLRPAGKKGFAFGSFGWAEKGATAVDAVLGEMGVEKTQPPLTVRFAPDAAVLDACRQAGAALGAIAAERGQ